MMNYIFLIKKQTNKNENELYNLEYNYYKMKDLHKGIPIMSFFPTKITLFHEHIFNVSSKTSGKFNIP